MKATLSCAAALLVAATAAQAADLQVPGDQPTIQQGIVAAADGDRVLVAPGLYAEHIDFLGKAIQLIGTGGARVTTLDGGGSARVVSLRSGETALSGISGFTIRHGATTGAGLDALGGGILVAGAAPAITDNRILDNAACDGGGIAITAGGRPLIAGNLIEHNQASCGSGYGGGIYQESDAPVTISDNRILENAALFGAGVATVGDVNDHAGKVLLTRNVIARNRASQMGGGVFTQAAHARLTSNLIVGNDAIIAGGVYVTAAGRDAHPVLTNNTLADNSGQEFQTQAYGRVDVANNIFRTSRSTLIASCQPMHNVPVVFTNNLVFATNGAPLGDGCTLAGTLLTTDPLFADGSGVRAYALQPGSPAIDAGDDTALQPGDRKDVLGKPRVSGAAVDLGAVEASGG